MHAYVCALYGVVQHARVVSVVLLVVLCGVGKSQGAGACAPWPGRCLLFVAEREEGSTPDRAVLCTFYTETPPVLLALRRCGRGVLRECERVQCVCVIVILGYRGMLLQSALRHS